MTDRDRLPPGQTRTAKWPVLHYGEIPRYGPSSWSFRCFGMVQRETSFTWDAFRRLPRSAVTCDIHCVTSWSRLDTAFAGVRARDVIEQAEPRPEAKYVLVHADPGYTTNLPLAALLDDDVLLATHFEGAPLAPEHGGPVRLVVPKLYFWKSAKWVRGFEFLDVDAPGFWEKAGYHLRGDPWHEERYSSGETDAMQRMRAEAKRRGRV